VRGVDPESDVAGDLGDGVRFCEDAVRGRGGIDAVEGLVERGPVPGAAAEGALDLVGEAGSLDPAGVGALVGGDGGGNGGGQGGVPRGAGI